MCRPCPLTSGRTLRRDWLRKDRTCTHCLAVHPQGWLGHISLRVDRNDRPEAQAGVRAGRRIRRRRVLGGDVQRHVADVELGQDHGEGARVDQVFARDGLGEYDDL